MYHPRSLKYHHQSFPRRRGEEVRQRLIEDPFAIVNLLDIRNNHEGGIATQNHLIGISEPLRVSSCIVASEYPQLQFLTTPTLKATVFKPLNSPLLNSLLAASTHKRILT